MNNKTLYKNIINLKEFPTPDQRIKDISKEIVKHSDYLPKTLLYEDIDKSFKEWVENNIDIIQDGKSLPTMTLFSNQRFSEYMQTWRYTDENNNIRLNFKTVTRENNPSHGTILGDTYNIPGDRFYTIKSIPAIDDSGKKYRVDYKMKQPTPVDLTYKVSVMTNKYTTLNEFNEIVMSIFKARQSYICPNGHYMSITLENISDESEYNIEDRQFFSQTFTAKVKGYIIRKEDLIVEENPVAVLVSFEGETYKRRKPLIEIYEYDTVLSEDGIKKTPIDIIIDLSLCFPNKGKIKFTIDVDFILTEIISEEYNNIISDEIKLYINDNHICDSLKQHMNNNEIKFKDGDEIILQVKRFNRLSNTKGLILKGYNILKESLE